MLGLEQSQGEPNMDQTDRLLGRREVERVTSLSKNALYRMLRDGAFPRQVRLGGRRVAWVECEVRDWMAARIAERDRAQT